MGIEQMTAQAYNVLQFGALGLLAIVLIGVAWAIRFLAIKIGGAFDRMAGTLDKMNERLESHEAADIERFTKLQNMIKPKRSRMRSGRR